MMLKHHIKVALRNIKKQGLYSLLNIVGLSIGITMSLLVLLLVRHELSYDKSFSDNDLIYRYTTKGVLSSNFINSATSPMPLSDFIESYDEVKSVVRLVPGANSVVAQDEIKFNEEQFLFGDDAFFDVFDLRMIEGDVDEALKKPRTVVISESASKQYFDEEMPLGQTISRSGIEYTVTGVCEDMPSSTHFRFNLLASLSTIDEILLKKADSSYVQSWKKDWLYLNCYTYVKFKTGTDIYKFEKNINNDKNRVLLPQMKSALEPVLPVDSVKLDFYLQPVTGIHLHSHLNGELEANSKPVYINLFVFIAVFILLITCINFVNLTTAKANRRFNEIALRQLTGASRKQLVMQFLTEAFIYSLGATFIGLVLLELLLPFFNSFFNLKLDFSLITGWVDLFWILILVIGVGILAGVSPAFFYAGLKPRDIIKGDYRLKNNGLMLRGILVCAQITVSVFLLIVVAGMWWQIRYATSHDPGFSAQDIVVIERGSVINKDYDAFKNSLLDIDDVRSVSVCSSLPGDDYFQGTFKMKNGDGEKVVLMPVNYVDQDYFTMLGLTLKTGRFLSEEVDDSLGIIFNAEAVAEYDIKKPLGYEIGVFGYRDCNFNVTGVVKDFHFEPFYEKIKPLALMLKGSKMHFNYILVKLRHDNPDKTIDMINERWKGYTGNSPFEWEMLSDRLSLLYEEDVRIAKIITVFALLALVMTIMGIIALAAFIMEYRSKMIGIKKVLGVSRQTIILQIFSGFGIYVLAGVILALVPAYIALSAWIESYAYYSFMPLGIFLLAALMMVGLAYVSIFYQTYRMASEDPVDQRPFL